MAKISKAIKREKKKKGRRTNKQTRLNVTGGWNAISKNINKKHFCDSKRMLEYEKCAPEPIVCVKWTRNGAMRIWYSATNNKQTKNWRDEKNDRYLLTFIWL